MDFLILEGCLLQRSIGEPRDIRYNAYQPDGSGLHQHIEIVAQNVAHGINKLLHRIRGSPH